MALIALVAIVGVTATGTGINAQFAKISCKITNPSADCSQTQGEDRGPCADTPVRDR